MGQFSFTGALLCAVGACLIADLLWYWLGVYKGSKILNLLCKISLEPDSCVRRTENMFVRYGARGLLFAKFVPGLSTAAAPLAGMFRMKIWKFALADSAGSLIWAGSYSALGFVFRNQLDDLAQGAARAGGWLISLAAALLGSFLLGKYIQRRRFFRSLHVARIGPEELNQMLDRGDSVTVVDLRNALGVERGRRVKDSRGGACGVREYRCEHARDSFGSRRHSLLQLTKRSLERPCGAHSKEAGCSAGASVDRRF